MSNLSVCIRKFIGGFTAPDLYCVSQRKDMKWLSDRFLTKS